MTCSLRQKFLAIAALGALSLASMLIFSAQPRAAERVDLELVLLADF